MKVIRKAVLDIATLTASSGLDAIRRATEFEDSYQYEGAIAHAQSNPPTTGGPAVFNPRANGSDYFWYTHAPISTLVSTAPTATALINLDADSDFYAVALTYQASIADAILTESSNVIPLIRVLITDTGSGKALSNAPLPVSAMMGDGKRPYRFVRPRVFLANATIQLAFTSYVAAGTTYSDFQVIFHGYKVYK